MNIEYLYEIIDRRRLVVAKWESRYRITLLFLVLNAGCAILMFSMRVFGPALVSTLALCLSCVWAAGTRRWVALEKRALETYESMAGDIGNAEFYLREQEKVITAMKHENRRWL